MIENSTRRTKIYAVTETELEMLRTSLFPWDRKAIIENIKAESHFDAELIHKPSITPPVQMHDESKRG